MVEICILTSIIMLVLILFMRERRIRCASQQKYKKLLSQKKSSETRIGHISETIAPFLDQFDFNPENCAFLGKPIDYISFEEDSVTLIEIKSGKSQLSKKYFQQLSLIHVSFFTFPSFFKQFIYFCSHFLFLPQSFFIFVIIVMM